MRILLIKTSSLGDVIHTFPAVSEAAKLNNDVKFDWVVEKNFSELPKWHSAVRDVIPIELRKWRNQLLSPQTWREWSAFVERLRRYKYDVVIDAQGLMKSAFVTRKALGKKCGMNWRSAWEPLASLFYNEKFAVDPNLHAIHRMQTLFGEIFDYAPEFDHLDFGVNKAFLLERAQIPEQPYLVFVHATTWETKHWPIEYWRKLTTIATQTGINVLLPWGNPKEQQRAHKIADGIEGARVLPKMNLTSLTGLLAGAKGVVAVDTGLAHISAALDLPLVSLYGPTDPEQTGTLGNHCKILKANFPCAPCAKPSCSYKGNSDVKPACFETITPEQVWQTLQQVKKTSGQSIESFSHHHDLQPA